MFQRVNTMGSGAAEEGRRGGEEGRMGGGRRDGDLGNGP